jgi:hypothetical protein
MDSQAQMQNAFYQKQATLDAHTYEMNCLVQQMRDAETAHQKALQDADTKFKNAEVKHKQAYTTVGQSLDFRKNQAKTLSE